MKINVFTKNIVVEPLICKDSKDKFKIILRYPNQFDATKILFNFSHENVLKIACNLFIKFENKPILINEKKEEIKYKDLNDMLSLGGQEILSIITDVIVALKDVVKEAQKVEKKP